MVAAIVSVGTAHGLRRIAEPPAISHTLWMHWSATTPRYRSPFLGFLLLLAGTALASAQAPALHAPDWSLLTGLVEPPAVSARSYVVVDVETETLLAAKQPDLIIPPASLTKIVAVDVALDAVERGELSLQTRLNPPPEAWAVNQPPHSSLMFLGPDQVLTVEELLAGLVISSGNDAAVALAVLVSGSVPDFVARMNSRVAELGLSNLYFEEPAGLSEDNYVTARDFARFLLAHLKRFPQAARLYERERFTYPQESNQLGELPPEQTIPPITQSNRNLLLQTDQTITGIKTGFIEASGYNFAVSAERDGRAVLAVILGIDAPNHAIGGEIRAATGAALLDYGYDAFELVTLGLPSPRTVPVYGGTVREVVPEVPPRVALVAPRYLIDRLEGRREQFDAVTAPFERSVIGNVSVFAEELELLRLPMLLPPVDEAGFLRRAGGAVVRTARRLFSDEQAVDGADLEPAPATRSR